MTEEPEPVRRRWRITPVDPGLSPEALRQLTETQPDAEADQPVDLPPTEPPS